jgi:hypothetical protein
MYKSSEVSLVYLLILLHVRRIKPLQSCPSFKTEHIFRNQKFVYHIVVHKIQFAVCVSVTLQHSVPICAYVITAVPLSDV